MWNCDRGPPVQQTWEWLAFVARINYGCDFGSYQEFKCYPLMFIHSLAIPCHYGPLICCTRSLMRWVWGNSLLTIHKPPTGSFFSSASEAFYSCNCYWTFQVDAGDTYVHHDVISEIPLKATCRNLKMLRSQRSLPRRQIILPSATKRDRAKLGAELLNRIQS